jgi:hypothetical protein
MLMTGTSDKIVAAARRAHEQHWRITGDESTGDKLAALVTKTWQDAVKSSDPERFVVEFAVAPHLGERIDLVDIREGIAYELKVSPNNAHFEFYRDVFKAVVAKHHTLGKLERLVFLTPGPAATKLLAGLAGQVVNGSDQLGIAIEIRGL